MRSTGRKGTQPRPGSAVAAIDTSRLDARQGACVRCGSISLKKSRPEPPGRGAIALTVAGPQPSPREDEVDYHAAGNQSEAPAGRAHHGLLAKGVASCHHGEGKATAQGDGILDDAKA